jgi:hypothetical protein
LPCHDTTFLGRIKATGESVYQPIFTLPPCRRTANLTARFFVACGPLLLGVRNFALVPLAGLWTANPNCKINCKTYFSLDVS